VPVCPTPDGESTACLAGFTVGPHGNGRSAVQWIGPTSHNRANHICGECLRCSPSSWRHRPRCGRGREIDPHEGASSNCFNTDGAGRIRSIEIQSPPHRGLWHKVEEWWTPLNSQCPQVAGTGLEHLAPPILVEDADSRRIRYGNRPDLIVVIGFTLGELFGRK
jgi:hypothetical protein